MNTVVEVVKLWRTETLAEDITKKLAKRAREKETKSILAGWSVIHARHKDKLEAYLNTLNYTPAPQFAMPVPEEFFELLQTENLAEKKFVEWLENFEEQLLSWYRELRLDEDDCLHAVLKESIKEKNDEREKLSLYAQKLTHILEK